MKDYFDHLRIKRSTKDKLYKIKFEKPRQSWDKVINDLMEQSKPKKKNNIFGRI